MQFFRALELPTQFLLSIFAARSLGPEVFGLAGVLISVQSIVQTVAAFGFDELLQREVARFPSEARGVVASALRARLVACLALWAMVAIACLVFGLGSDTSLIYAVLGFGAATGFTLLCNLFLSVAISTNSVVVPMAASFLSWAVPLAAVATGKIDTLEGYAFALAAGGFLRLMMTIGWAMATGTVALDLLRLSLGRREPWLLDRPSAHASVMVYALNNQILARHGGVVVAGVVGLSFSLIGSFALAFQITSTANSFLLMGVGAVGLSRLSEKADDLQELGRTWRQLSALAAKIAFGPLAILALLAHELVVLALGSEYPLLQPLLVALVGVQWLNRVTGGGTNIGALIARGEAEYVARSSVVGALMNILLAFALVPFIGVAGLVVASAVSICVVGISNTVRLCRDLAIRPPLLLLVGISALMAGCLTLAIVDAPFELRIGVAALVAGLWVFALLREVRK